jgi:hypothetical protein
LIEVGIFSEKVTLHGFFLNPEQGLLAKILFALPDEMDIKKTYSVDITQMVDGTVTGGLTFVVPGTPCPPPGDVSGDNTVSAYDAALILKYVVGLIDHFPVYDLSSPSSSVPRNVTVSLPNLSTHGGKRIQVPITIDDATGLNAGGLVLRYDPTILKAVSVTPQMMLNGSYWKANTKLSGEIRFAFASSEPATGQGNLIMAEFDVLPNAEGKTSPLALKDINLSNSLTLSQINGSVTVLPSNFALMQNYPNPFNPETWIPFKLAADSPVTISIYSQNGRLIHTIALGNRNAGVYVARDKAVYWDGKDNSGEKVASGVYYYTLQAGKFRSVRKMVILK